MTQVSRAPNLRRLHQDRAPSLVLHSSCSRLRSKESNRDGLGVSGHPSTTHSTDHVAPGPCHRHPSTALVLTAPMSNCICSLSSAPHRLHPAPRFHPGTRTALPGLSWTRHPLTPLPPSTSSTSVSSVTSHSTPLHWELPPCMGTSEHTRILNGNTLGSHRRTHQDPHGEGKGTSRAHTRSGQPSAPSPCSDSGRAQSPHPSTFPAPCPGTGSRGVCVGGWDRACAQLQPLAHGVLGQAGSGTGPLSGPKHREWGPSVTAGGTRGHRRGSARPEAAPALPGGAAPW